jgi:antitoxin component YwqK of YwqJK toxin-antitoxin module
VITYRDGQKHGEMKIYGSKGKKLITHKLYKNGDVKKNFLKQ